MRKYSRFQQFRGRASLMAQALKFDPASDGAPRLLARGEGNIASEIIEIADRQGIPTISDRELSYMLHSLPIGSEAPENLFRALAGIFAFLNQAEKNASFQPDHCHRQEL